MLADLTVMLVGVVVCVVVLCMYHLLTSLVTVWPQPLYVSLVGSVLGASM